MVAIKKLQLYGRGFGQHHCMHDLMLVPAATAGGMWATYQPVHHTCSICFNKLLALSRNF
jgi:hypothetical protein